MLKQLHNTFFTKLRTPFLKNSFWGVLSNVLQNLLFSAVFVIITRKFSTTDFASYILANTLYAFVVAFSSLGLGQWFIRELLSTEDKKLLINKFFKIQIIVGVFFFGINILIAQLLYEDQLIKTLSLIIGINIIFDNIIFVIKHINIAHLEQIKTFKIITIEAFLKLIVACSLFIYATPIVYISILFVLLRLITLNLFVRIGSSKQINLQDIVQAKVSKEELKQLIYSNWPFVVIGSISVIYWGIGKIIISKMLPLEAVAHYDISLKLWSIVVIVPVILTTTLFPLLIKSINSSAKEFQSLYRRTFLIYTVFGIFMYTIIQAFSDFIIPYLFGERYFETPQYCKEMFLTILLFPTALLQANVLIAMKLEKLDMWFNTISLVAVCVGCFVGLYFLESLSAVNYSIFFSFLIFHILQDIVLVKNKITTLAHTLSFYAASTAFLVSYYMLSSIFDTYYLLMTYWIILFAVLVIKNADMLKIKIRLSFKNML
ncbi:oligosaccharide flippase family protein [Pontibacter anaerobius]|uniref:Oligosaccharide flippase family protein n=1 Tax=Pontibacter anaerobius TaxID=2993940 RepID=A0ABT3RHV3_9BACT|nr:oligosaccharide flippase family protein [Pontibacter anaerobius]MCX2740979.1 oligosaccharide flippase family protein [Pontibacter anaerobius]